MSKALMSIVLAIATHYVNADLVHECYPNGTISVTNPDVGSYTNVYAVENEGSSIAVECSVSTSGPESLITGCSQDESIAVHFSNRDPSAADGAFGGNVILTYEIECANINSLGLDRTVVNNLGATLEKTTQAAVTPSFVISSALRQHSSPDGSEVFGAKVGTSLYWTIDVPAEYNALPSCYAYSGSSNSGSPSIQLVNNGCVNDSSLIPDVDFSAIYTFVPNTNRYYVTLYVFQFYNSEDIYFECNVKVCPSGSSFCDFDCGDRKRSIDSSDVGEQDEVFRTGQLLHIVGENSAATSIGCIWMIIMAIIATIHT